MIQTALRASNLAVKSHKPFLFRVDSRQILSSNSQASFRHFFSTRVESCGYPKPFLPRRFLSAQSVRYCSHQRTMCKAHEDITGGIMDITNGREVLPTNVKPIHYSLTLEPDFEKFTYEGEVVIEYVQSKSEVTSENPSIYYITSTC